MGAKSRGAPSIQEDRYYTPSHKNYLEPAIVSEWLRIRMEPKGASINYKRWLPVGAEIQTHCDEYETPIGNPEVMLKILDATGFKPIVTVKKHRDEFVWGEFVIAFDTVEGLGEFIEVESKSEDENVDAIHGRITEFLSKTGAQLGKQNRRGYPFQLLQRQK
jgi:adenylate cyclase class 2